MPDLDMMGGDMPQKPDNHEAQMARADLYKLANYSMKLFKMIQEGQELEGWVQAKITKAADYIASVYHFMEYEMKANEYGEHLESAEIYSESVKLAFQQKLMEAKAEKAKKEALAKKKKADEKVEEGFGDTKSEKEKTTGKFDKKEIKPGVTQYTRKSSTFTDGGKDSDQKKSEKKSKTTTESFGDTKSEKEKTTGKFDKKEIEPGVTRYTRKSSTFTDGGDDKAVKAAKKKEKATKEDVDKSKIPAAQRKAQGGDWKVSKDDLDDEEAKKSSSKAGLEKLKKDTGVKEAAKPDFLDVDGDGNKKEPMKKALKDKKTVKESSDMSALLQLAGLKPLVG
jgi:hypothetical protein